MLGRAVRDQLHALLMEIVPGLMLDGHPEHRLPNTLNDSFPGVSGRDLLHAVGDDVTASVGSACHSDAGTASGVLAAMGIDFARALGAGGKPTLIDCRAMIGKVAPGKAGFPAVHGALPDPPPLVGSRALPKPVIDERSRKTA
jgi:hypothetical protein